MVVKDYNFRNHIIQTRDAIEARDCAKKMVDLHWAKLNVAATTKSKYRDEGMNPDNPWSKMTPKADEPVQKRKRPTLKDAPPLTFPKLPRNIFIR